MITKECGSGKDADCQNTGACGQGTWEVCFLNFFKFFFFFFFFFIMNLFSDPFLFIYLFIYLFISFFFFLFSLFSSKQGIVCEYPELAPEGTATANWRCGTYGTRMSCQDYVPNGGALVGVCGSGSHEDCSGVCNGAHAVLCSKNENSVCVEGEGGVGSFFVFLINFFFNLIFFKFNFF